MKRTRAQRRLDDLLDEAEQDGRCLLVRDESLRSAARRRLESGELLSPFPSMVVRAAAWKELACRPRIRWRFVQNAFMAAHPERVLCSFSAALEYGLWVPRSRLNAIHIAVDDRSSAYVSKHVHRHYCHHDEVTERNGIRLTKLMRTVLDCSLEGTFEEGLAIADSALRYCDLDPDRYRKYVAVRAKGRPGADNARMVARYMDGDAENAGESIVRAKIIELGYEPPTRLQHEVLDPVEEKSVFRVDMYYLLEDGTELFVEVDGLEKYGEAETGSGQTTQALVRERQRESHLTACGAPVMRILFARINEPGYLKNLLDRYNVPKA